MEGRRLHRAGAREERAEARLAGKVRLWAYHDLRRTNAREMTDKSIVPHVVEQALTDHKGGVAGIYDRSR
jgi:hypothetical protein